MGYAYRSDRYRYIEWIQKDYTNGETEGPVIARELYNYKKDPKETRNLIDDPDYQDVVSTMQRYISAL